MRQPSVGIFTASPSSIFSGFLPRAMPPISRQPSAPLIAVALILMKRSSWKIRVRPPNTMPDTAMKAGRGAMRRSTIRPAARAISEPTTRAPEAFIMSLVIR